MRAPNTHFITRRRLGSDAACLEGLSDMGETGSLETACRVEALPWRAALVHNISL